MSRRTCLRRAHDRQQREDPDGRPTRGVARDRTQGGPETDAALVQHPRDERPDDEAAEDEDPDSPVVKTRVQRQSRGAQQGKRPGRQQTALTRSSGGGARLPDAAGRPSRRLRLVRLLLLGSHPASAACIPASILSAASDSMCGGCQGFDSLRSMTDLQGFLAS